MSSSTVIILAIVALLAFYLYSRNSASPGNAAPTGTNLGSGGIFSSIFGAGAGSPISSARNASNSQLLGQSLKKLGSGLFSNQTVGGPTVSTSPDGSPGLGFGASTLSNLS